MTTWILMPGQTLDTKRPCDVCGTPTALRDLQQGEHKGESAAFCDPCVESFKRWL